MSIDFMVVALVARIRNPTEFRFFLPKIFAAPVTTKREISRRGGPSPPLVAAFARR
jgi:hypothetical protein